MKRNISILPVSRGMDNGMDYEVRGSLTKKASLWSPDKKGKKKHLGLGSLQSEALVFIYINIIIDMYKSCISVLSLDYCN